MGPLFQEIGKEDIGLHNILTTLHPDHKLPATHIDGSLSIDSTFASNHSRHSDKVNCLDCHMPKYVQGLETIVRSHTISSPSDFSMLDAGHPNACNLCRLDKPIRWTVEELNKGWGTEIETDISWIKNYAGSLRRPVGLAWLRNEDPVIRPSFHPVHKWLQQGIRTEGVPGQLPARKAPIDRDRRD